MLLYKLVSNNFSRYLRNILNIKPTISYKPKYSSSPISDFFFWEETNKMHTKFFLTNLASQVLPDIKQTDSVKLYIYDNKGDLLKVLLFKLDYLETLEVNFSEIGLSGHGSFFVFHKFKDSNELLSKKSHIADRGYISYSDDTLFWKYMHGNNYSAYEDQINDKIDSIMTKTFKKYKYTPQVSFTDCENFDIILNNPGLKPINVEIKAFIENDNISKKILLENKSTSKISFNHKQIEYIEIISNFLMFRPVIVKKYNKDFDIFHG
tara:strand:- start:17397 stop:18191 length:795 start_codon:yes stop_codon:yes gene_type:complete